MRRLRYIIGMLLLLYTDTWGQNDSIVPSLEYFDQEVMEKDVREVHYEKNLPKLLLKRPKTPPKKKEETEDRPTTNFNPLNTGIVSTLQYIFFGFIILAIVGFMIRYLNLKYGDKEKEIAVSTIHEDEIEDINDVDPDSELKEAFQQQDYRKACRMMFLKVLQHLNTTEQIKWKKEKTNRHYLREMSSSDKVDTFRNLTLDYERVWYGDRPMDGDGILRYADLAREFVTINVPTHVNR